MDRYFYRHDAETILDEITEDREDGDSNVDRLLAHLNAAYRMGGIAAQQKIEAEQRATG